MRKILSTFFSVMFLLGLASHAAAQSSAYADLRQPDASQFPRVSALLDVFDAQGKFASGLQPSNVTIFEDGQSLPVDDLVESPVGAQIVVAVNPGPSLDLRGGEGLTRYQRVSEVLGAWAQALPAENGDDLSLVSTTGPVLAHGTPTEWAGAFAAYQPDFRAALPGLQALSFAFDTVSLPTEQPGMKRAILLLTPHIEEANIQPTLEAFTQRALDDHIRVFVWLIDSEAYYASPSAVALQAMAQQTGGGFVAFSGTETLPNPESYFSTLRSVYHVTYTSQLNTPGEHSIAAQINVGSAQLETTSQTFAVDIQPPNPILVSLPEQIVRQPPEDKPFDDENLVPTRQKIDIIVEFPDGHPRDLQHTALYVDGQMIAENTDEPFDTFTWDLSQYDTSAQHQVSVEATDVLGLTKASLSIPVIVTIVHPPGGPLALLARNNSLITIAAIALAALVLVIILFSGSRRLVAMRARREVRKAYEDPLTQPVVIAPTEPKTQPKDRKRRSFWSRAPKEVIAPAYLVRVNADGEPVTGSRIPILGRELTFGTDPVRCSNVLDDPSISPLHARLRVTEDKQYVLSDQDSVAGTWVNYEPVTRDGRELKHGDLVYIGQMGYRFTLHNPPEPVEPKITTPSD